MNTKKFKKENDNMHAYSRKYALVLVNSDENACKNGASLMIFYHIQEPDP